MRIGKQATDNKTLPFFPGGFPDETISSRVSRYHIRRGQPKNNATYSELFSRPPFSLTPLVQPHLDQLAIRLPGSPVENLRLLQDESTLLPLFKRFFGTQSTRRKTVGSEVAAIELPRRLVGGSRLTHLCTECLTEDEKSHGCRYIHRSHQIPGVTACWMHGVTLIERCPSCRQPFAQPNRLILSAWMGCDCGHDLATPSVQTKTSTDTELEFAKFARALLAGSITTLTATQLVHVYKTRGMELGFKWGNDRMSRKNLFAEIEVFFGAEFLSKVDPSYSAGKISGWFHVLQASLTIEAPLYRHLLFAFFLFRDAATFLASIDKVIRDGAAGHPTGWIRPQPMAEKSAAEALMDEMIDMARRNGYDSQKLWHKRVGSMKRLVRYIPDACYQIDARLKVESDRKNIVTANLLRSKASDQKVDAPWATAITEGSTAIYRRENRPFRVTMNRLLSAAAYRPKSMRLPTSERTPLARAAAESNAESTWHFYARRMLWTLQSLDDPATAQHTIVKLSGLEVFKAREILKFFEGARRCGGASIKEISQILASRGVGRDWAGPCPEKAFYRAGRAYKLRTSRQGPIGGRTGDAEPFF